MALSLQMKIHFHWNTIYEKMLLKVINDFNRECQRRKLKVKVGKSKVLVSARKRDH